MKKLPYIIIVILVVIAIAILTIKKDVKYKDCVIKDNQEEFEKKSYDLKKLSFNDLKIGDSSDNATPIIDSSYKSMNEIKIQDKDNKIVTLLINGISSDRETRTDIFYNNKKLETLNNYIEAFGQYDEKISHYNEKKGYYDIVYIQSEQKQSKIINEYKLTISYQKNDKINSVKLEENEYRIIP